MTFTRCEGKTDIETHAVCSVARRSILGKDGMRLLKVGRFHINLAYIQFIHEEREDFILHFSEGANIRTTSVPQHSPDGELLQRFMNAQQWAEPAPN